MYPRHTGSHHTTGSRTVPPSVRHRVLVYAPSGTTLGSRRWLSGLTVLLLLGTIFGFVFGGPLVGGLLLAGALVAGIAAAAYPPVDIESTGAPTAAARVELPRPEYNSQRVAAAPAFTPMHSSGTASNVNLLAGNVETLMPIDMMIPRFTGLNF